MRSRLVLWFVATAVLFFLGVSAQASTVTYYACVNNTTGAIKIVGLNHHLCDRHP